MDEEGPALSVVLPGVKVALRGGDVSEVIPFPYMYSAEICMANNSDIDVKAESGHRDINSCIDENTTFIKKSDEKVIVTQARGPVTIPGVRDSRYFDNVLTQEECAGLVASISNSHHLSFWSSDENSKESARLFRDADTIEVDSPEFAEYMWKKIQPLLDCAHITIDQEEGDPRWERELVGVWEPCGLNPDMLFARYLPGGHFAPHTDGRAIRDFNCRSFYSVIVYLNTIPVRVDGCTDGGGGTRFYQDGAADEIHNKGEEGKKKWTGRSELVTGLVDPVAGRLLMFEQSLVHEGVPPASEHCKYIIRSDVLYQRTPSVCDTPRDIEAYRIFREAEQLAEEGRVDESIPMFRKAVKMSPAMAEMMGN